MFNLAFSVVIVSIESDYEIYRKNYKLSKMVNRQSFFFHLMWCYKVFGWPKGRLLIYLPKRNTFGFPGSRAWPGRNARQSHCRCKSIWWLSIRMCSKTIWVGLWSSRGRVSGRTDKIGAWVSPFHFILISSLICSLKNKTYTTQWCQP